MLGRMIDTTTRRSTWALFPAAIMALAAILLFAVGSRTAGLATLVAALVTAWITDRLERTRRLLPDLTAIGLGLAVIASISLHADLSDAGIARFAFALSLAVVLPWLFLQYVVKDNPIRFPWGGWRWSRAQWAYLVLVIVVAYLLLPYYFLSSGVYRNWPAIHTADELARLFIGVNAVGIWDELFFICTVFVLLRRHLPAWQANLVQAAIFVSFLWELGYQSWGPLLTIPFALVQGAIFQLTKNLTYVITVHLLFDLVVFLILVHAHNPDWPHLFVLLT